MFRKILKLVNVRLLICGILYVLKRNRLAASRKISANMDFALHRRALEHFNRGEFFDAHEVWEDVWRASSGPEKRYLQGLIQVAVALHHHSRGNLAGARSLLRRAAHNLTHCPAGFGGIDLAGLRSALEAWQESLAEGQVAPPPPKL